MASVWCILLITEIDMTRHTQQCVEKEKDDDDDYTLYHHKTYTHTHTKQTDAKRREKNQENQTHTGHKKNAGDGQTEREKEYRVKGEKEENKNTRLLVCLSVCCLSSCACFSRCHSSRRVRCYPQSLTPFTVIVTKLLLPLPNTQRKLE